MFRRYCFILIALLLSSSSALAYIEAVYFDAEIMEGDDLFVMVEGLMPDGCWEFLNSSTNAYNQMLVVYIDTIYDAPAVGGCPQVLVPYDVEETFADLSQGSYTLRIYENRPPMAPETIDYQVEVTGPVSSENETWDSIKAIYR